MIAESGRMNAGKRASAFGSQYCCSGVSDANQLWKKSVKETTKNSVSAVTQIAIAAASIFEDMIVFRM